MFSKNIDYLIGVKIMGYSPVESAPIHHMKRKTSNGEKRILWTNAHNEQFYFQPTSSAEHSRQVAKKMVDEGFEFRMYSDKNQWICSFSKDEQHFVSLSDDNESICYAALKAYTKEGF